MNFIYENQSTTSFLSYVLEPQEELDYMGLGMVQNNKMNSVLPITFTQMDEERYLRYNISSTVTLNNFFNGIVTKARLLGVFESICDAFLTSEEYLLESAFFVLEKEYMFCDVSTGKTNLIYLPVLRDTTPPNLSRFFKETIFSIQSDMNEDSSYIARIISYLNANENFSLKEFQQLIIQLKQGGAQPAAQPAPAYTAPAQPAPVVTHAAPPAPQKPAPAPAPVAAPVQPTPKAPAPAPVQIQTPTPAPAPAPEEKQAKKSGLFGFGAKKEKKAEEKSAVVGFAVPGAPAQQVTPIPPMPSKPEPAPVKKGLFGSKKEKKAPEPAPSAPAFSVPGAAAAPAPVAPAAPPQTRPAAQAPVFTPVAPVPNNSAPGTTVLSPDMLNPGTTVLNPSMMPGAKEAPKTLVLTRLSTKEQIMITKNVFRIGKERSYVDYFIADNSAISRSHADIIVKDGEYFIRDNNSLNHTYLDDAILQSNQEYPVQVGSKIVLADEEFSLELV